MKALILKTFGTPYEIADIPRPQPQKGEVLVKIAASGVNPLDLKIKAGQAAHAKTSLPAILGIDMAGVVVATGEGVTTVAPGDEVYGMTGGVGGVQGSLAEYAAVDASLLAKKPASLTMREAAALPLAFITAWEGLVDRAGVGPGKKVLVHGGAGGVGHIAIQLAKARGAEVFTTIKPSQQPLAQKFGATAIDYTRLSVEEYVKDFTGGEGFDIVFDTLGGETLDNSFKAVRTYEGHVVSILGWGAHSLAPLSFRGATYSGVFTLLPLITGRGRAHHGNILKEAAALADAGRLKPLLDPAIYTMDTIEDAYTSIQNRTAAGKVVVSIP
ncbi:MAG: zinc-dependent alcohol dehydrogenase family protein [Bacteroidetes bacterium]|nr:zinc-dependent alcohol dehydrogenase family protein [Bacteroidota bacterium]